MLSRTWICERFCNENNNRNEPKPTTFRLANRTEKKMRKHGKRKAHFLLCLCYTLLSFVSNSKSKGYRSTLDTDLVRREEANNVFEFFCLSFISLQIKWDFRFSILEKNHHPERDALKRNKIYSDHKFPVD